MLIDKMLHHVQHNKKDNPSAIGSTYIVTPDFNPADVQRERQSQSHRLDPYCNAGF